MSDDAAKLLEEINGIADTLTFSDDCADQLLKIPSVFRRMAIGAIVNQCVSEGLTEVTPEILDRINKERTGG